MKYKVFSVIALAAAAFTSNAGEIFTAEFGGPYNKKTWTFEVLEEGKTCKTASAEGLSIEYGPNQYNPSQYEWHFVDANGNIKNSWELSSVVPNEIDWIVRDFGFPTEVTYKGNTLTVVEIGDFSFTGRVGVAVVIPETIKKIGKGAFYNANQPITLHDGITYIDDFAFAGNTFTSLNLDNLEKLGNHAFRNCNSLTDVTIKNVDTIGDYAFFGTTSIENITLGNVRVVGDYAFTGLEGEGEHSTSCGRGSTTSAIKYLDLGEAVTHIGKYAFAECHSLAEINIPNSVKYVDDYAFYHCQSACPLIIGKNVEYIGDWAFNGRTLKNCNDCNIELPASIKHVGSHAFTFNNERGFSDLYVDATTPPEMATDEDGCTSFGYYDPSKVNETFFNDPAAWIYAWVCLHVPAGCKEIYSREYNEDGTYNPWSQFQCIIDDVVPDFGDTSIDDLEKVGYAFMVPDEDLDLNSIIYGADELDADGTLKENLYWKLGDNNGEVSLNDDQLGSVHANKFGQVLAVVYRKGETHFDGNSYVEVDPQPVGCVIVFVCPTVTITYDNKGQTEAASAPERRVDDLADPDPDNIEALIKPMSSYEHRVIYNSLPRFNFDTTTRVEIQAMSRGEADENKDLQPDENGDFMTEIDKDDIAGEKRLTDDTDHEFSVVPVEPITNNRVIQVTITDNGTLTSVETVTEITKEISVRVNGHTVTVVGAEDDDVVNVHNAKGQLVYSSRVKTFDINERGVYVATVGDGAFKILVK